VKIEDVSHALRERGKIIRANAEMWQPEVPPEDTAPAWNPDAPDCAAWGVTADEAQALLRRQMCPVCGQGPWASPLTHTAKRHGLDRYTVREACGLNTVESVADPEFSARLAEREKRRGQDMSAIARRPRPRGDRRHMTTAGRAALTQNFSGVTDDQRRAAAQASKTPEAIARQAASLKATWAKRRDGGS
jgi:hypothetical protein